MKPAKCHLLHYRETYGHLTVTKVSCFSVLGMDQRSHEQAGSTVWTGEPAHLLLAWLLTILGPVH